uniref:Uncharacterized protein n=1 Tax=Arion vulgaris TaxID=1028688 RepID=A0A0B6YD89_9EUPU
MLSQPVHGTQQEPPLLVVRRARKLYCGQTTEGISHMLTDFPCGSSHCVDKCQNLLTQTVFQIIFIMTIPNNILLYFVNIY